MSTQATEADWEEYERRLKYHDWWHAMSDDGRVWRAGMANEEEIQRIRKRLSLTDAQRADDLWDKYNIRMRQKL